MAAFPFVAESGQHDPRNSEANHDPAATLVSGKCRPGDRSPRHRPGRQLPRQADPLGDPVRAGRQLRRDVAYRGRSDEPAARPDGADRQSSGGRRRGRPGGRGQRTGRRLHDRHGELHRGLRRADLCRQAADAAGPGAGQHADHVAHPRGHALGQPLHRHQEASGRSKGQARHGHHGSFGQRHDQPRGNPAPAAERTGQVQHHPLPGIGAGHRRPPGRHDRLLCRSAHQLDAAHPVGQAARRL